MRIDPSVFTDDAVSDETRAFNAKLQHELLALPKLSQLGPQLVREARRSGNTVWGPVVQSDRARTINIGGPDGPIEIRVIDSPDPHGIYIHIHGGGFALGAADLSDVSNEEMADAAGVTVASIEYRLAPEHPYPAGVEDCIAATTWIIDNARKEFGTDTVTIGGESAGANLAAATMIEVASRVGWRDWAGANLVYGGFDISGTPSARDWDTDGLILDSDTLQYFNEMYYPADVDDAMRHEPRMSPLFGDLSDLGPALFTIGTWDPLLDDTLFMATKWLTAGNETELAVYPGGVHGFDTFPIAIGVEARHRMHEFIRRCVTT